MKWEYRTEIIDTSGKYLVKVGHYPNNDPWHPDAIDPKWDDINALGQEGWELAAVFASRDDEATAIFKRQKI